MAATTKKIYTVSETAAILQTKLGGVRSWPSFLNDCQRGQRTWTGILESLVILPCGFQRGRRKRPMYAAGDIAAFIQKVWALVPESRGSHEAGRYITADFDDGKPWQLRRLA